ncbi:MAG: DUF5074 domain-containing protein [Bacteroidales bacterium]|jgi:YVTN family beta-propeller protein
MISRKWSLLSVIACLFLTNCTKDKPDDSSEGGFLHGAYISNEGAFGNSNGSVSYFDTDSAYIINHVFEAVNGRPLGDVVQSMAVSGDKGFIIVNNSQKVEVVDLKTFASIGVIDGLEYPRSFLPVNTKKGYLTDGNFSGRVYVIDIETLIITDTIPVGAGPEKLVQFKNNVIVTNSGGWGNDSTLSVIDTGTDKVIHTWMVGMNPADVLLDKNNLLWVLCKGKVVWNEDWTIGVETTSSLVAVDPETGSIKQTQNIGAVGDFYWPLHIGINKNRDRVFYLESGGIYSRSITNGSTAGDPFIRGNFYGFGIDPETDLIYALYAPSFTTSGWMFRHKTDGQRLDSLEVGIGPGQVVFN